MTDLVIAEHRFGSRLFSGTGKFASAEEMTAALSASGTELVTLSLRRMDRARGQDNLVRPLQELGVKLLPNTSGARTAAEAVYAAQLAREALQTPWIKLEIHPDPRYLMPDPLETLEAAESLINDGFVVMPYVHADPVLCKRLEEVGCPCVMPLGAPIGSNAGIVSDHFLRIIIEQAEVPVVVDAGIGAPSHASYAMELGADACLVNTAMAVTPQPERMARAFAQAVEAGRAAFEAGLAPVSTQASATSSLEGFLETLE